MTKQQYYSLQEDLGALQKTNERLSGLIDLIDVYPQVKTMTVQDAKEYIRDISCRMSLDLQKKLNVE